MFKGCSCRQIKFRALWIVLGVSVEFLSPSVQASEVTIIEVHRNIPLSDVDTIYKDFYLNGGNEAGLKKNMVVNVVRKIGVKDATGTESYGDIIVPIGQLKIIAVFNKIAVARELKIISRESEPLLDQVGIMTGDRIQTENQ